MPLFVKGMWILRDFLVAKMSACALEYHGHVEQLYVLITLSHFIKNRTFMNHRDNLACTACGYLGWASLQGIGDHGATTTQTISDI